MNTEVQAPPIPTEETEETPIDPAWLVAEWDKVRTLEDLPRRLELEKLVHTLTADEAREFYDWADRNTDAAGYRIRKLMSRFCARWAELDPRQALKFIDARESDPSNPDTRAILTAWAGSDPDDLLDWIVGDPKTRVRRAAGRLALASPQHAIRLTSKLHGAGKFNLVALSEWATRDSEGALRWIENHFDSGARREEVLLTVGKHLHPNLALEFAANLNSEANAEELVADALADRVHQDPLGAMDAFGELPESLGTDVVLRRVLRTWWDVDKESAKTWVKRNLDQSIERLLFGVNP